MSPELHQRIRRIFDEVLDRPDVERLDFLKKICGTDEEIFRAVERLLEARGESSFLDRTSPATRHFGRYVISSELGRGAMGIVYKAADPLIGRAVAIKIIHLDSLAQPDDAGFMRERLFREARSAGGLSHPGIVTIFDVGQENDVAFVAMEFVDGPTLQQMLASWRRFECGKALDILRQTASALDYAHQNGVIHRDVKPANIMVHDSSTVKITDFGIAKVLSGVEHTRTGMVLGTPSYMSPEQIGARPLDGRSDQFSLAAVAFQLLTGTEPFQSDSLAALLQRILYEPRLSARALNPVLPHGVDRVLHRGLEKSPALRYETCTEFVIALEKAILDAASAQSVPMQVLNGPVEVAATGHEPPKAISAAPAGRAGRRILALGATLGIIAIFGSLIYFSGIHFPGTQFRVVRPLRQTTSDSTGSSPRTPAALADVKIKEVTASAPAKQSRDEKPTPDEKPAPDDKPARARRIYDLAIRFREAQRTTEALDLFRQAAGYGEVRAMVEAGETLMNGADGVSADYPEALRWLRQAADAGDPSGMVDLGGMYLLGNGVEEDPATAAQWFSKAAAAGNPAAMYDLGLLYESGSGVAEDRDKARQLFNQSAALGNQQARTRLAEPGR